LKKKIAETSQKDLGGKIAEPEAAQEALNDTSFIEDVCDYVRVLIDKTH
jgi:hypothetical protein